MNLPFRPALRALREQGLGPARLTLRTRRETFRKALSKVDFEPGSVAASKGAVLGTVLTEARQRDAMTLWYLLSRVEPSDRLSVYGRLAVLVPPPKGTTREGLLSLDREMLDRWREEIDKARGLNRFGSLHSTLRFIWTGTHSEGFTDCKENGKAPFCDKGVKPMRNTIRLALVFCAVLVIVAGITIKLRRTSTAKYLRKKIAWSFTSGARSLRSPARTAWPWSGGR